jgi:chemotaxis signal transduction protein
MADKKERSVRAKAKTVQTVSLSLGAEQIQGKEPVVLLTASQVDEVLAEANIQALPFAEEYLVGLCAWRGQVLPIIDLISFFGLTRAQKEVHERYVVVRTVNTASRAPDTKDRVHNMILRCVLKVSDQIISGDMPAHCKAVVPQQADFAPFFVQGLFQGKNQLFILPDIAAILHANDHSKLHSNLHSNFYANAVGNTEKKKNRGAPLKQRYKHNEHLERVVHRKPRSLYK